MDSTRTKTTAPRPQRHPNRAIPLGRYRDGSFDSVGLAPPPGNRSRARLDALNLSAEDREAADTVFSVLFSAEMGDWLEEAFGPPDAEVSGKYRPAQLFAFEAEGEIIIALCEKEGRGTFWSWWPDPANTSWKGQHVSTDADSPAVAHFWPAFVEGLMAAIGRPLTRPDLTFHPDTPHGARTR